MIMKNMKSESGYKGKTKAELSDMERDELLKHLSELKGVLDHQSGIINQIALELNAAVKDYDEKNKAMITAKKELDDLIEKHIGGKEVDLQVQMEVARLKGIESFAADSLQRARKELNEKEQIFNAMVDDGIDISNEIDTINEIADKYVVQERENEQAKPFDAAAVYEHKTRSS